MGLLKNGEWHTDWYDTDASGGEFQREDAGFRDWVVAPGAAAPPGHEAWPAASGRYHLIVSWACPWAHRTLIFRRLKGLEQHVGVSVVDAEMLERGWCFSGRFAENVDPLHGVAHLYELYQRARSDYTGRVTVPVLWDRERDTIVSNESADIIRMFNSAFDGLTGNTIDFYPALLRREIDEINAFVYESINNGVYRSGFATTQSAYKEAFDALFAALDRVEQRLSGQRYLVGDTLTEADWRLFTTLVRFDAVYVGHFKCNRQRIEDYPALSNYLRDLYQLPGVADTVVMDHIKTHYYYSHDMINPTRVVPRGPVLDLDRPHDRARLGPAPAWAV
ncbi:MAG: glutathione S-transferase family protein [Gammaproteobacteria bacterium]|nr:MAG: glutathione S-transferase family protein [Gammaproteobacteria bacterium]